MESTSFTLSVKQEAAPRPKRKAKKRAVWPHLLMQAFLAAVLLYLGIMIAQSASIHTTGAGNVVLAAAALMFTGWKLRDLCAKVAEDVWRYCGDCFRGEIAQRGKPLVYVGKGQS